MTPEQLKSSILQYVIQGKLVEQRPKEGTGEELYQQMRKEIKTLERQKRFKVKDDSAISEDEIPFDIPESWKWLRLGQILNIESGKGLTAKQMRPGEIPVFGGNGIIGYHDESLIEKETVVIGRVGFYCGSVHITPKNAWITDNAFITTYPEESINREYLVYVLRHMNLGQNSNATAQPVVSGKKIYPMLFPLPPLAEQKRIVAKIEKLLPLVDRYAVAYEKLEQFSAKFPEDMKKSILQYAIQGKLVEQRPEEGTGEELYQQIQVYKQELIKDGKLKKTRALEPISEVAIPFDFPPSWKVCYIDDIAFVTKLAGFEYTKYIADNLVTDGIPLFKGKNVQNGKLVLSFESYIPESISDELPRSQIAKKCLLTPYVGTIGNIAIFDGSFKAHLGSNVGKIELLNSDTQTFVLEEYVLWYLKSTYGYAELTKHKKATAQESISIDAIRNVIIAIPPLEEQYRIVAKIEELLPLCERLRK